jgi:two-component system phosphate regulon sensor histidine kinase PhoR
MTFEAAPKAAEPTHPGSVRLHAGLEQFAAVSSIFDAAEMVLYVADMQTYELLFMNAQAEQSWGRGRLGEPCYRVLQNGQSGPCSFCTNSRLIAGGPDAHPVTWEFQNTVTQRWYLCIDRAIPWSDGRLVRMEVAIDITERKLQEEFREQYVGLISHDLRTPISTIALSTTLLKALADRAGIAKASQPLEAIRRSTRHMSNMIEDLLETTRLESGQLQLHRTQVDLGPLVAAVAQELGTVSARPIAVQTDGLVPVVADAPRIQRVLENLIGNALRYSPAGAPVQVTVQTGEHEAVVTVSDCGSGIAPDLLPKLFQRFSRAPQRDGSHGRGLGLGLYNSRLIIEHHDGRIWVESPPGSGSSFFFTLPLEPGDDTATARPGQQSRTVAKTKGAG